MSEQAKCQCGQWRCREYDAGRVWTTQKVGELVYCERPVAEVPFFCDRCGTRLNADGTVTPMVPAVAAEAVQATDLFSILWTGNDLRGVNRHGNAAVLARYGGSGGDGVKVLGIDPGSSHNGWALLEDGKLLDRGQISGDSKIVWGRQLNLLTAAFRRVLAETQPALVAIEKTAMGGGAARTAAQAFSQAALTRCTEELAGCIGMMAARQGIDVVRVTVQGGLKALGCKHGATDREAVDAFMRLCPDSGKLLVKDHHEARAAGIALRGAKEWQLERARGQRQVPA